MRPIVFPMSQPRRPASEAQAHIATIEQIETPKGMSFSEVLAFFFIALAPSTRLTLLVVS